VHSGQYPRTTATTGTTRNRATARWPGAAGLARSAKATAAAVGARTGGPQPPGQVGKAPAGQSAARTAPPPACLAEQLASQTTRAQVGPEQQRQLMSAAARTATRPALSIAPSTKPAQAARGNSSPRRPRGQHVRRARPASAVPVVRRRPRPGGAVPPGGPPPWPLRAPCHQQDPAADTGHEDGGQDRGGECGKKPGPRSPMSSANRGDGDGGGRQPGTTRERRDVRHRPLDAGNGRRSSRGANALAGQPAAARRRRTRPPRPTAPAAPARRSRA